MEKEDAINYLQRKGKIRQSTKITEEVIKKIPKKVKETYYEDPKFNKEEEKEIKEVMKEGKIYGDPIADIEF